MSDGDFVIGNNTRTPDANRPALQIPPASATGPRIDSTRLTPERRRICEAMSQQRGDSGHESAPQQFVRLVGCRDPAATPDPRFVRSGPGEKALRHRLFTE